MAARKDPEYTMPFSSLLIAGTKMCSFYWCKFFLFRLVSGQDDNVWMVVITDNLRVSPAVLNNRVKLQVLQGRESIRTQPYLLGRKCKRMEPGGGEKGRERALHLLQQRVYFCVCLSAGKTREMYANSGQKVVELVFVFGWLENAITSSTQTSHPRCRREV